MLKGLLKIATDYAPGIPRREDYGDIANALKPGDIAHFALQHHDTVSRPGRPHYDMRIGTDRSGMYSWALPKARMPEAKEKSLAVQTFVHRPSYNSFQGRIGKGYGAGNVRRVDLGKAVITKVTPNALQFTLSHRKVPVHYGLIKIKTESGKDWLLTARPQPGEGAGATSKPVYKHIQAVDQDEAMTKAQALQSKIDEGDVAVTEREDNGVGPADTDTKLTARELSTILPGRRPRKAQLIRLGRARQPGASELRPPSFEGFGADKAAAITLDIEKGDTLLGGRFKNMKTVVEDIGTDELGQPTVNGKKLLSFRIQKLMPAKTAAVGRNFYHHVLGDDADALVKQILESGALKPGGKVPGTELKYKGRPLKNSRDPGAVYLSPVPIEGQKHVFKIPEARLKAIQIFLRKKLITQAQMDDYLAKNDPQAAFKARTDRRFMNIPQVVVKQEIPVTADDLMKQSATPSHIQRAILSGNTAVLSRGGSARTPAKQIAAEIRGYLKAEANKRAKKGLTKAEVTEHLQHPDMQHVMSWKEAQAKGILDVIKRYRLPLSAAVAGGGVGAVAKAPYKGDEEVSNWDYVKAKAVLWRALNRLHKGDADVKMRSDLDRIAIPKSRIKEQALKHLGYVSSVIAVPETGQDKLTTFRNVADNSHIHSHPRTWMMHRDEYTPLQIAIRKGKTPAEKIKAIGQGTAHFTAEGVPGMINYIRNKITGNTTMEDRIGQVPVKKASALDRVHLQFLSRNGTVKASATVEVADTFSARKKGLSKRASLGDSQGMFFDKVGTYWMKDTYIPLDIVFTDAEGTVLGKQAMPVEKDPQQPSHFYTAPSGSRHAVELPLGFCDSHGIGDGDTVRATGA